MNCPNSDNRYCYCKFIQDGKCPIIEIKKIVDRCKHDSKFRTSEFINAIIALNIIEKLDKIEADDKCLEK